ncbi:DNA polymerase [Escherichia coli]
MEELALDYPLPKVLLEYRGLAKLKLTYTDKLPLMINREPPVRITLIIRRLRQRTFMLSDPNLQNIPVRNEVGRRIR